jgi:hypothetical protein
MTLRKSKSRSLNSTNNHMGTLPWYSRYMSSRAFTNLVTFWPSGETCETPPSLREACLLCYKCLISHSTEALNAASLPAFSFGLFCTRERGGKNVRVTEQTLDRSKNTHQVTANGKSVGSSGRVRAVVPRSKVRKFLIGQIRKWFGEPGIELTRIDEERSLALLDINLRCNVQKKHTRVPMDTARLNLHA